MEGEKQADLDRRSCLDEVNDHVLYGILGPRVITRFELL
jgi:hypothetical protein